VLLCTDGPVSMSKRMRKRLEAMEIRIRSERIVRLEGRDGLLDRIVFQSGEAEARRALFFSNGQHQASDLPARLGCRFTKEGAVATGKCEATNVPGLYVCGDASKEAQFVWWPRRRGPRLAWPSTRRCSKRASRTRTTPRYPAASVWGGRKRTAVG
jgi:Pyruvate/2-oxoglutarate dehydrogenase complex, dihydrolipoamide dehydrogenase (E3) component, and related enzymes